ncbi:hypothetical protein TPA0905_54810 [Streptomyces olivaceus]|nr:hypothetical protein TPA0905_54810 [Streptomyces olivaceus]
MTCDAALGNAPNSAADPTKINGLNKLNGRVNARNSAGFREHGRTGDGGRSRGRCGGGSERGEGSGRGATGGAGYAREVDVASPREFQSRLHVPDRGSVRTRQSR